MIPIPITIRSAPRTGYMGPSALSPHTLNHIGHTTTTLPPALPFPSLLPFFAFLHFYLLLFFWYRIALTVPDIHRAADHERQQLSFFVLPLLGFGVSVSSSFLFLATPCLDGRVLVNGH